MTYSLRTSLKVMLLVGTVAVCGASDPPATLDATVKLSGGVLAAGIGYKWGHGTLNYQGRDFRFCIRGLSVGDVGAVNLEAHGAVFNLKSLEDFSGEYFSLSTGVAIAVGESATILKNKRGVMMELESKETGVRFNIAASGLKIIMANNPGCRLPKSAAD